jgi:uncharacterized protein (TIGR02246 family)
MKSTQLLLCSLVLGFTFAAFAQEDDPIGSLSEMAQKYVTAYNGKNLDEIVALYTEEAELIDDIDAVIAAGKDEIRDRFEASFTEAPNRKIALDVLSVREISENLVVEEGLARFSGENSEEEDSVVSYSAILVKSESGWLVASSRELNTETIDLEDPLEKLTPLSGEWTMQGDQMQMDLTLEPSPNGSFLLGKAITTTPADGAIETEIRIGYDGSRNQLRWWAFDEFGGYMEGPWQELENSWLVRTNGVTADGETTSAIQELEVGSNMIRWTSTRRFLNGEAIPDLELRLVRRPPAPSQTSVEPGKAVEP